MICGGRQNFTFLASSQMMLMLPFWGPHFEKHFFRETTISGLLRGKKNDRFDICGPYIDIDMDIDTQISNGLNFTKAIVNSYLEISIESRHRGTFYEIIKFS